MMFDRQHLETFSVVVESRNFGEAAKTLNVSRGAISQRIIALEESFGVPLLVREGNVPTPAGEALLRHIRSLELMEADTLQQIKPTGQGRTAISVAVNADSLATWFESVACAIAREHFALELIVDDQDFTLPVVVRGEAVGCISTANNAPTGFVADALGAMQYDCVASPEFCRTHFPNGFNLHSVLAAPAVLFNRKDSLHAMFLERTFGFPVGGYRAHFFPSPVALLNAIRSGVGYGLIPAIQTQKFVESGCLVPVTSDNSVFVDLFWHHWESAPPNVRAVSEMVMTHARESLVQGALPGGDV